MRFAVVLLLSLVVGGCAQRDEIIATVPDPGAGGAGAAAAHPIVRLGEPVEHTLVCGDPSDIGAGDVDGDGVTDVLVGGGCLNVLRGSGDTLSAATSPIAADFGGSLAVGYVDTTHPDQPTDPIDVVGFSQPTRIYLGDGAGSFAVSTSVDAGPAGGAMALANMYGDGALELITAQDGEVALWTGDGTGSFIGPHPFSMMGAPRVIHATDFDGDGHADLLVATSAGVFFARNIGNAALAPLEAIEGTTAVGDLAVADLDGDGCMDALAVENERYLVLLNDCAGGFTVVVGGLVAGGIAIAAEDMDDDGVIDVIIATEDAISIAGGQGGGAFGALHPVPIAAAPRHLLVVDVAGDARPDVVISYADGVAAFASLPLNE